MVDLNSDSIQSNVNTFLESASNILSLEQKGTNKTYYYKV